MERFRGLSLVAALLAIALLAVAPLPAAAASASTIDGSVDAALTSLYSRIPEAQALAKQAKAVLVFPKILKVGFLVGGHFGEGALRVNGHSVGYFSQLRPSMAFRPAPKPMATLCFS